MGSRHEDVRERLLTHLIVALAVIPKHVKRHFLDGNATYSDPARSDIAKALADMLMRQYELLERPPRTHGHTPIEYPDACPYIADGFDARLAGHW